MQDDPVRILDSSNPVLARAATNKESMLLYDLRIRSKDFPNDSLTYVQDGRVVELTRIGDDPFIGKPLSLLARKTLYFRSIPSEVTQPPW